MMMTMTIYIWIGKKTHTHTEREEESKTQGIERHTSASSISGKTGSAISVARPFFGAEAVGGASALINSRFSTHGSLHKMEKEMRKSDGKEQEHSDSSKKKGLWMEAKTLKKEERNP